MPPDLLAQSCKRVVIAAMVFALMWLVTILLPLLDLIDDPTFPTPGYAVAGSGLAISIAMTFTAGQLHDRPELPVRSRDPHRNPGFPRNHGRIWPSHRPGKDSRP